ncbi:MAG TPA: AAA family ATPase [Candidatus Peribacteraceae bacterium]|nr:AAA family ATPase [Candidatus Peribacteraceae bacterium]
MKCVIIIGPQAVGKMTVGRAIAAKTGYKLLHNHMTIDFILNFFEFKSASFQRLDSLFRFSLMKEVADSDLPGFIFTFIWGFNRPDNWEYIQKIEDIFSAKGHEVVFLELEADLDVRKERNVTPLRLEHKPSKRNIVDSEKRFLEFEKEDRLNPKPGELAGKKHLKINNDHLSPEEVAQMAIDEFDL